MHQRRDHLELSPCWNNRIQPGLISQNHIFIKRFSQRNNLALGGLESQGGNPFGSLEDPVEDAEHAERLDGRAYVVRAGAHDPQEPLVDAAVEVLHER
eukprot:3503106-Pyramimonas_sp.AAC.1